MKTISADQSRKLKVLNQQKQQTGSFLRKDFCFAFYCKETRVRHKGEMLQCITSRELGVHPPFYLERNEKTRRTESICLSQKGDFTQSHSSGINSIDIDPIEGRYLLSCSSNSKIFIHDTARLYYSQKFKCETVCSIDKSTKGNHQRSIESIQWYSQDTGMFLTSSADKTLKVWDTNASQVVDNFHFEGIVYNHQIGRQTKKHCLVAVGCEDSRVYLCDLLSGSSSHILRGHSDAVLSLAWSPRNHYVLASGSRDNKVLFWDIRKATESLFTLDQHNGKGGSSSLNTKTAHNGHINSLHFTGDGLFLLSYGTDNRLRLWDTYTGKNTLVNFGLILNDSHKSIQCDTTIGQSGDVAFVPSAKNNIEVFNVHSGSKIKTLGGHFSNVNCCTFQQNFQVLFSGSNDCQLLSWLPNMEADRPKCDMDDTSKTEVKPKNNFDPYKDTWSSDEES